MVECEVTTSSSFEDVPVTVAITHEGGSLSDASIWLTDGEEEDEASFLDREGKRRHEQFYSAGYRDGVTAGRSDAAQDGFSEGFKGSMTIGYKWGIVRGVTSAFAHIPNELMLKLVESEEKGKELMKLYEAVYSIGKEDALNLFYEDIQLGASVESNKKVESESSITHRTGSECSHRESYIGQLDSILKESSEVDVQPELNKIKVALKL